MQGWARSVVRVLPLILAFGPAGCGLGTAGVVAGSSGGSSGNAPPTIGNLRVEGGKVSPATLRFVVADPEGDMATVEFFYTAPGKPREPLAQIPANPAIFATSTDGIEHELAWTFPLEMQLPDDASFVNGVELVALPSGGTGEATLVGLGNDPPEIVDDDGDGFADGMVPTDFVPGGEASGLGLLVFEVRDSSGDVVDVVVEYAVVDGLDVEGGERPPDSAFRPATATGQGATGVEATEAGRSVEYTWSTFVDVPQEHEVVLRLTPDDRTRTPTGTPVGVGVPVITRPFRVDNNEEPAVQIEEGLFLTTPDEVRGIPIAYRVFDEEGDPVRVVFQWRREGEPFPPLPSDPDEVGAILRDPEQSRRKQVCTLYPSSARGRVEPVDASRVRLPELGGAEARLLARDVEGLRLELLRPSAVLAPVAAAWRENPLEAPVAALPLADGRKALVLEGSGIREPGGLGAGTWRLREIELANGAVVREVASAASGNPSAMAFERDERTVLVAADLGGLWRVDRVDLESGAVVPLVAADEDAERGSVRGLASLGSGAALATIGNALVRLDWNAPGDPRAANVLDDLATPWGIVLDPLRDGRAYLAERDAVTLEGTGRLVSVDLVARAVEPVVARSPLLGRPAFPRPTALALEGDGTRLIALCDSDLAGRREVRGVRVGRSADVEVFTLAELPGDACSLAAGAETSRLSALPVSRDLAVGGGVEQIREIESYARATRTARVGAAFDPPPRPLQAWRIRQHPFLDPIAGSPGGASGVFVWNSRDVPGGGSVLLRAHPFDAEMGLPDATRVGRRVTSDSVVPPIEIAGFGSDPSAVAAADLDGDGDLDLVSANRASHNLTVFLQDAAGDFDGSPVFLGVFGRTIAPSAVSAADHDRDGDLDLVSANSNSLTIFFQPPGGWVDQEQPDVVTAGVFPPDPASVVAADIDGDGNPDLASTTQLGLFTDQVVVFFQPPGGWENGTQPDVRLGGSGLVLAVAAADLDGDIDLDLVSANFADLSIFFQPPGGFASRPADVELDDPTMLGVNDVAAADIDGDGNLDLASGNFTNLTIFLQGPGGWMDRSEADVVLGGSAIGDVNDIALADLDTDGNLDVIAAHQGLLGSSDLTIFFQPPGGFPAFSSGVAFAGVGSSGPPDEVAAADLDGDGGLDLVSANGLSHNLTIFFQKAPGKFDSAPFTLGDSLTTPGALAATAADLDGDGDLDLVAASIRDLTVFFQTAPGMLHPIPLVIGNATTTSRPHSVAAADLDGDGDLDLVSANGGSDEITIFFQPPGGFVRVVEPDVGLGGPSTTVGPRSVAAADLDGDGDLDLVSSNAESENVTIFFQPAGGWTDQTDPDVVLGGPSTTHDPRFAAAADLDGDGDQDLVSANRLGDTVTVFLQPPGGWADEPNPDVVLGGVGDRRSPVYVTPADLDDDGDLDLVVANQFSDTLTVFFQNAPASFDPGPLSLGGPALTNDPFAVTAADVDGDGDLDLASANGESDTLTVFLQSAPGRFDPTPLVLDGPMDRPRHVVAADVDGDGDLDLVSVNERSRDLTVFWGGR